MRKQEIQEIKGEVEKFVNIKTKSDLLEHLWEFMNKKYSCCYWNALLYDSYAMHLDKEVTILFSDGEKLILFGYVNRDKK